MAEALQRMMGNEQMHSRGAATRHACHPGRGESVVDVMPTGWEEHVVSCCRVGEPGGLTVVVVPLIALRGDLHRRCTNWGYHAVEWESRRPPTRHPSCCHARVSIG